MKRPLRNTTYEDAVQHAQALITELKEREDYRETCARAEELGVTITVSPRHTYTDEFAARYVPNPAATGQLPLGYAMELWFDITRGGRVLVTDEENPVQCSVSATACETCTTLILNRLNFYPLDHILARNPICAMLEEFLDGIAEGAYESPFVTDTLSPVAPVSTPSFVTRDAVEQGAYVEFSCTPYVGTFGADTSLYLASDTALPYRLFLLALTKRSRDFEAPYITLASEEASAFADCLDDIPDAVRRAVTFADLFADLFESPLAPTPRAEQLLDCLTICRTDDFLADCARLSAFVRDCLADDNTLTVIW